MKVLRIQAFPMEVSQRKRRKEGKEMMRKRGTVGGRDNSGDDQWDEPAGSLREESRETSVSSVTSVAEGKSTDVTSQRSSIKH
jgi:hypothetical protein